MIQEALDGVDQGPNAGVGAEADSQLARIENQVAWLARHRRVQLHVAPTGSSWLTQGELGGYLWARSLYNRIPTR